MNSSHSVAFEVTSGSLGGSVSIRLADHAGRWVAQVQCGSVFTTGLGAKAREALVAALASLGPRVTTELMADPAMFGASADVNAMAAAV